MFPENGNWKFERGKTLETNLENYQLRHQLGSYHIDVTQPESNVEKWQEIVDKFKSNQFDDTVRIKQL